MWVCSTLTWLPKGSQKTNKRLTQLFGRWQLAATSDPRPFVNSHWVTQPPRQPGVLTADKTDFHPETGLCFSGEKET